MRYKSKYTFMYIIYILNSKSLDLAWLYIIDHYLIDRNHLPLSMKWSSWLALNGSCIIINVGCCGEKKNSTACLPFCVLETIETCSSYIASYSLIRSINILLLQARDPDHRLLPVSVITAISTINTSLLLAWKWVIK